MSVEIAAVAVFCFALAVGLSVAAAEESVDLHRAAWMLARKASGVARRLSLTTSLDASTIGARVLAMCRREIEELSRAAAPSKEAAIAQEARLREACFEVASKVATDARA